MAKQGVSVLGTLGVATVAWGQAAITIEVDQPVLQPGESTTITLWAGYSASDWAMAFVETDFVSSQGAVGLSDWALMEPMHGPGTLPGEAGPTGIDGILAGQLNFPVPGGPEPTNPIAFWQATYMVPMDAAAMEIDFSTVTTRFEVYATRESVLGESRLDELAEGAATIHVVPAPAGGLVLGAGVLLASRRRR
jgi:hypothetical protein